MNGVLIKVLLLLVLYTSSKTRHVCNDDDQQVSHPKRITVINLKKMLRICCTHEVYCKQEWTDTFLIRLNSISYYYI